MFILISRCAGEVSAAYRMRFHLALSEFQDRHKGVQETPHLDGVLLSALGGERLYASYRGL